MLKNYTINKETLFDTKRNEINQTKPHVGPMKLHVCHLFSILEGIHINLDVYVANFEKKKNRNHLGADLI